MPEKTEETRRVGREIKRYLAVHRISREQFCFETKLGKGTVDKLMTGLYSEATLQIVLERTGFVRSNSFAAKHLGEYARSAWTGYLRDYLHLRPTLSGDGTIEAFRVSIEWDDNVPGMVLVQKTGKVADRISWGALWIPHQRSPLIYIQSLMGRVFMLSTMVGEPVMRGLLLIVNNLVANAYVPVCVPVSLRRLEEGEQIASGDLGSIHPGHAKFGDYQAELNKVVDKQFGRLISFRPNSNRKKA